MSTRAFALAAAMLLAVTALSPSAAGVPSSEPGCWWILQKDFDLDAVGSEAGIDSADAVAKARQGAAMNKARASALAKAQYVAQPGEQQPAVAEQHKARPQALADHAREAARELALAKASGVPNTRFDSPDRETWMVKEQNIVTGAFRSQRLPGGRWLITSEEFAAPC